MNLTAQQRLDHETRMRCGTTYLVKLGNYWLRYVGFGKTERVGCVWDATGFSQDDAKIWAQAFNGHVVDFRGV